MAMTVEQIIEEIKTLSPKEQERLRDRLAEEASPGGALEQDSGEEEFKRRLLAAGLIKEIKRPACDQAGFDRYQPIRIRGKPISETIIEERR